MFHEIGLIWERAYLGGNTQKRVVSARNSITLIVILLALNIYSGSDGVGFVWKCFRVCASSATFLWESVQPRWIYDFVGIPPACRMACNFVWFNCYMVPLMRVCLLCFCVLFASWCEHIVLDMWTISVGEATIWGHRCVPAWNLLFGLRCCSLLVCIRYCVDFLWKPLGVHANSAANSL